MRSKQALPIMGTLYAVYDFTVYFETRVGVKKKGYVLEGNATSSNCAKNNNSMIKNSFLDAKYRLFNIIGGSHKFTSKLLKYMFVYNEGYARGKKGKTKSVNYYNDQIPDTERNYETRNKRTNNPAIKRTYKRVFGVDKKTRKYKQRTNNKNSVIEMQRTKEIRKRQGQKGNSLTNSTNTQKTRSTTKTKSVYWKNPKTTKNTKSPTSSKKQRKTFSTREVKNA